MKENYTEEFIESPETKKVNDRIHNLFDISKEGFKKLSERIKDAKGLIRIFIHPFYEYYYSDPNEKTDFARSKLMTKGLIEKNLSKNIDVVPPLIIFEGRDSIESYRDEIIPSLARSTNETYFVPTFNFNSTPNPFYDPGDDDKEKMDTEWKIMNDLLSSLGVTKIVLGGYQMGFSSEKPDTNIDYIDYHQQRKQKGAKNQKYFPKNCVGNAYAYLSKQFDVELSNFAYPDNREQQIARLEEEKS